MIPKDDLTPVDMPRNGSCLLDFLRGFALLGIMFVKHDLVHGLRGPHQHRKV